MAEFDLMTEKEAARRLSISPTTLRVRRCTGPTPNGIPAIPFVRIGRAIRYRRVDIEQFVLSNLNGGTLGGAA